MPSSIPLANGNQSAGYGIKVFSGDPNAGGVEITPSLAQGGDPVTGLSPNQGLTEYVGWVWNYDQGLLFVSDS